jgi:hypothetical protein
LTISNEDQVQSRKFSRDLFKDYANHMPSRIKSPGGEIFGAFMVLEKIYLLRKGSKSKGISKKEGTPPHGPTLGSPGRKKEKIAWLGRITPKTGPPEGERSSAPPFSADHRKTAARAFFH